MYEGDEVVGPAIVAGRHLASAAACARLVEEDESSVVGKIPKKQRVPEREVASEMDVHYEGRFLRWVLRGDGAIGYASCGGESNVSDWGQRIGFHDGDDGLKYCDGMKTKRELKRR